jgi:transposase InsO family protein
VKYAFIQQHRHEFSIVLMCHVLGVSRSGFYAAHRRAPSQRERTDQRLRVEIRAIHQRSRNTYGSPRIHAELRAQGTRCGRKRVERLMRIEHVHAKPRRRTRSTTNSNHTHPLAANLLQRRFGVSDVTALNTVWVGDITYIPTREGWLYLAVLLDLASRSVVGWAMQPTLEQSLTMAALEMAIARRQPAKGVIHHTARGVQYAAGDYQALLVRSGMTASMSRKGDCYDNAVAESFFATLEWEVIERADWHTRLEARRALFEYIEVWYNRQRRHSTLGYLSPAEYETHLAQQARAA